MNRTDERREIGAGMARSPGAAHSAEAREQSEDLAEQQRPESVKSTDNALDTGKSVESHHVMGGRSSVHAEGAEAETDLASAKANRKEASEPEREEDEKSAMGSNEVEHKTTLGGARRSSVANKNTMGHGERTAVAKHTI